jgi:uncharacterized protein (DUF433 family)
VTIKWVKVDPLVMNGEPFLYNSRLTVRQLLELRRSGKPTIEILKDHPELRTLGIAKAYAYAAANPRRYAEFFDGYGNLLGSGLTPDEARALPGDVQLTGIVVDPESTSA